MAHRYLSLRDVESFVPYAAALGVSRVARSPRGFLAAYRRAGGDPRRLPPAWRAKREAFLARHLAQQAREPAFVDGVPTRRTLALIMWAYFPT